MRTDSAALLPAATLDEDAWKDLLSFIEERQLIPIVGPELLQVSTDRGPRQLAAITAFGLDPPLEFAQALYAQALGDPAHRAALLREAAAIVDHLIPSIASLHDTREWRARIEAAQHT